MSLTPLLSKKPADPSTVPAGFFLSSPIALRAASLDDLPLIALWQRTESNKLGFLTHRALEQYADRREIMIATWTGVAAGYLVSPRPRRWPESECVRSIVQLFVVRDRRRLGIAAEMIAAVEADARGHFAPCLSCRVAATLPANLFWHAQGFDRFPVRGRPNKRRREVHTWRKFLTRQIPLWAIDPERNHA